MKQSWTIKHPNGSKAFWAYNTKTQKLDTSFFGSDGYYVATKSKVFQLPVEDLKTNLEALERLGCEVIAD